MVTLTITARTAVGIFEDNQGPTAPVLSTTILDSDSIRVNLVSPATDSSGIGSYQLERSLNGTTNWTVLSTNASFPFDVNSLSPATQYFFRARATDTQSNPGSYSGNVSGTTHSIPTAPVISVAAISTTQINVSLTSASSATVAVARYEIERSLNGTTGWVQRTADATFPFQDTGLTASTQYFYRARAIDSANNTGTYSTVVNATTQAASGNLLYETNFSEFTVGATVSGGGNSEWTWDEANEAEGSSVRIIDLGGGQKGWRFRWPAGAAWAEQRFTLPNRHLEIVFKQTVRIPANFNYNPGHANDEGGNNKAHIYLWGAHENSGTWSGEDDYGGCGRMCGIGFNMWPPEIGPYECEITPYMFGTVGGFDTHNPSTVKQGGDTWDRAEFIAPADIGQTVTFYTRLKAATSADNNGIIQVWKKRGSTVTQVMNITTGRMFMTGQTGWNKGYVWGYANARYTVQTDLTFEYFAMHNSMPAAWAAELGI